jgi:hypothetical protein
LARRHVLWLAVAAGMAAVTVTVPPLILPRGLHGSVPGRTAGTRAGAATTSAGTATATGSRMAAIACATTSTGPVDAGRPSCRAYHATLGKGWQITGLDTTWVTGDRVPGTQRLALRVEPRQHTASVTLVPAAPVLPGVTLTASVYGGRTRGTSLRVSAGAGTSVVLTAGPDRWTSFTVDLAALLPGPALRRLDFALAYDLTPNTGRFFLDDIALVG